MEIASVPVFGRTDFGSLGAWRFFPRLCVLPCSSPFNSQIPLRGEVGFLVLIRGLVGVRPQTALEFGPGFRILKGCTYWIKSPNTSATLPGKSHT